jgi:hypothetical protein
MSAEVFARVAKLFRLSESSNAHEAALAASRAQELIDRHKLDVNGINLNDSNARARGRESGRRIQMNGASGSLASGARTLQGGSQ